MTAANPTREEVATALFNVLNVMSTPGSGALAGTFQAVHRGLLLPTDQNFTALAQPFLCLWKPAGASEEIQQPGRGLPAKRIWWYLACIYCSTPGPGTPWETIFDPLADALETALAPDNGATNLLTLGGLVDNCLLQGEAHINSGDLVDSGQGSAIYPIRIVVP